MLEAMTLGNSIQKSQLKLSLDLVCNGKAARNEEDSHFSIIFIKSDHHQICENHQERSSIIALNDYSRERMREYGKLQVYVMKTIK